MNNMEGSAKISAKISKKTNLIILADYIIESLPPLVVYQKELYYYNGKYYEELSDFKLGQYIQKFFIDNNIPSLWSPSKTENLIKTIKLSPKLKEVKEFDFYDNLINLNNGVFDFESFSLTPHSPDYYFTTYIDVDYKPDVNIKDAKTFWRVLYGIFRKKDGKVDLETITSILKLGGYLLYPQNKIEKLFMFIGEGANGKSLVFDIYKMFFPAKFVSALSLNTLSDESSFKRSKLINSRVNISTEQKGGQIDSEEIKKIISGEEISIDRKFKEPLIIRPRTKIIVATNSMPFFNDTSYGMLRRLYIVNFKNKFVDKEEYENEKELYGDPQKRNIYLRENKDYILEEIKKEKVIIFKILVDALKELIKDGWILPETGNTKEIKKEYREGFDTLGTWLLENYKIDKSKTPTGIEVSEVMDRFNAWYRDNFPGKKFNYSTRSVGRKIKDVFRVEPFHIFRREGTKRKCITVYPILEKEVIGDVRDEDVSQLSDIENVFSDNNKNNKDDLNSISFK